MTDDRHDHYEDDFEEECPNCGGEGFYYSCEEEWACVDPEGGCDLCMRRCDWCNPKKPKEAPAGGISMEEAAAENFGLTEDDL